MRVAVFVLALGLLAALVAGGFALAPEPMESTGSPPGFLPGPIEESLEEILPQARPPPTVRFLAWGDAGHGNEGQHAVARAAQRVCGDPGCDLVLMLGDNVYPDGVRSASDAQFGPKFEAPYANLSVPFYASLGNHDVALGKVGGAPRDNGDFMVAYDARSEKWTMPARHYAFREGDVQVVVLDLTVAHGPGANATAAAEQLAWLDETWDEDARWRVAVGHFPYASLGKHGNATGELKRFLETGVCGKADLYLAGHDHDLQWLPPAPACPGTELVVSGAASAPRPLRANATATNAFFARGDTLGFFWFEAQGDRLVGRAYDASGEVLFERALTKGDEEAG